ncbi:hypothetical protein OBBRIDRAFT_422175 [Obba rivulosa]|uniref:Uncharacterized protein n=1 Tax=Obba rivulosa TaxID=1052685 RepID=A0A8E2DMT9_9APHY|nr:hypothetical protein OBBRIDRAFT_422175 [Obba rivulosa]
MLPRRYSTAEEICNLQNREGGLPYAAGLPMLSMLGFVFHRLLDQIAPDMPAEGVGWGYVSYFPCALIGSARGRASRPYRFSHGESPDPGAPSSIVSLI